MERPRLPDTPFWVEPESVGPEHLKLSPEESHHLLRVHRAKPGTPFEATDGRGGFFECVLESEERRSVVGRILSRHERRGELPRAIQLLVGLPDVRAVERVVEHGVPLGLTAIDFAVCEHSERSALGAARISRLERIARAALKQSRRSVLPSILSSPSLAQGVEALAAGARFLADPDGERFTGELGKDSQVPIQIAVGPPGGFDASERRLLLEADFSPISLGPSRLTTETACVASISLLRNAL